MGSSEVISLFVALSRIPVVGDFLRSLLERYVVGGGNGNAEHMTIAGDVLKNIGPNVTRQWLDEQKKKDSETP